MNYYNSSIAIKRKTCVSCRNPNAVIFSKGRCSYCAKKEDAVPQHKKFYSKGDDTLQQWFLDRRQEMTGKCACGCGSSTSKNDDKLFKHSICHILEKRNFDSVKTHPLNFIELAFWGGCHSRLDDLGASEWHKKQYWPEIVRRFKIMYPCIKASEHQFIPQVLLDES